jgi:hypothetical protein
MCIVIDERETKLYDAVVELRVRHVQRVPDQVVKRVLVLGDICIRNERPRRVL